jgi:D-alanyl-D-alanine carboxypeptidase
VKTGSTGNAGACLVSAAWGNGEHTGEGIIGVVLDAAGGNRFSLSRALLDFGFSQIVTESIKPPPFVR